MWDSLTVRKIVFAIVASLLVGAAVVITVFADDGQKSGDVTSTPSAVPAAPTPTMYDPTAVPVPTVPPSASAPPATAATVKAPLSEEALADAADAATTFLVAYGSFNYQWSVQKNVAVLEQFTFAGGTFDPAMAVVDGPVRDELVAAKTFTEGSATIVRTVLTTSKTAVFVAKVSSPVGGADGEVAVTMRRSGSNNWLVFAVDSVDMFEGF